MEDAVVNKMEDVEKSDVVDVVEGMDAEKEVGDEDTKVVEGVDTDIAVEDDAKEVEDAVEDAVKEVDADAVEDEVEDVAAAGGTSLNLFACLFFFFLFLPFCCFFVFLLLFFSFLFPHPCCAQGDDDAMWMLRCQF